jgi:hypothetical protein
LHLRTLKTKTKGDVARHIVYTYTHITPRVFPSLVFEGDLRRVYWDDVAESIVVTYESPGVIAEGDSTSDFDFGTINIDYYLTDHSYVFCDGSEGNYFQSVPTGYPYAQKIIQPNALYCVGDYGSRHTLEWTDKLGVAHLIEIEERDYSGAVEPIVNAGASPASYRINADGEDRDYVILATELKIRIKPSTPTQYAHLYTEDARKYRVRHFRAATLVWIGYLDPFLYEAGYVKFPEIEISATCGLASLKELDFRDIMGDDFLTRKSALRIITQILKKLDLDIELRIGINVYETNMASTDADDPLAYTIVNPLIYYDTNKIDENGNLQAKTCADFINGVLREFSASIAQVNAKWVIFRREETVSSFDFREFDLDGAYITEGSINPVSYLKASTQTTRLCWKNQSGHLQMNPSFGTFKIIQKLNRRKSLLPSYGFELWNVVPYLEGTEFFDGWNIEKTYGTELYWGHEVVERDQVNGEKFSSGAMYLQFQANPTENLGASYEEGVVSCLGIPITIRSGEDTLKIAFDYKLTSLLAAFPWIMLEYKVKIGDWYLKYDGSWTDAGDPGYVEFYSDKYNDWQSFSRVVALPDGYSSETEEVLEFYLRLNNGGFSIDDVTDYGLTYLDDVVTVGRTGLKRVIYEDDVPEGRYYYELEEGSDTTSYPDVIRAGDWASGNKKVWRLKDAWTFAQSQLALYSISIDNAIIQYLPNGEDYPEEKVISIVNSVYNKRVFELEILHGDLPTDIPCAANGYDSHYTVSESINPEIDYEISSEWTRDGLDELTKIQSILLKSILVQRRKASIRLTGTCISDVVLTPCSSVTDTMDGNRIYQVQGLEIDLKTNDHTVDLYELRDPEAAGNEVTPFNGAFDPLAFGVSFD